MNTRSIVSVNPANKPAASAKAPDFIRHIEKPVRVMQKALRLVLGVGGSTRHSRRLWTFRVIIGAVIMCFGLLFSHHTLHSSTDAFLPGISYVMIAGGAMIACGLLTRAVSAAMGAALVIFTIHAGMASMEGYATAICAAMCVMSFISGSGRYSLDTIIYNALSPIRDVRQPAQGCSSLRRHFSRMSAI